MRKIIRVNGEEIELDSPKNVNQIAALIGAGLLDTVLLADRLHVMLVDDNGIGKQLPVNAKATIHYHEKCIPGTTAQIHGDVVIVPDSDFGRDDSDFWEDQ